MPASVALASGGDGGFLSQIGLLKLYIDSTFEKLLKM